MKRYRTSKYSIEIEEFELVKETEKTIWFKNPIQRWASEEITLREEKELKETIYNTWHDTFEDAKNYLVQREKNRIEFLLKEIEISSKKIEKINQLNLK